MLLPHPIQQPQLLCLTNGQRQKANHTESPVHTSLCLILTFKRLYVLYEMLILQGEIQAGLSSERPGPVVMGSKEALHFFCYNTRGLFNQLTVAVQKAILVSDQQRERVQVQRQFEIYVLFPVEK